MHMKTGKGNRPKDAMALAGGIKDTTGRRKASQHDCNLSIPEAGGSDGYLEDVATLFPEWDSTEEETAFRDL